MGQEQVSKGLTCICGRSYPKGLIERKALEKNFRVHYREYDQQLKVVYAKNSLLLSRQSAPKSVFFLNTTKLIARLYVCINISEHEKDFFLIPFNCLGFSPTMIHIFDGEVFLLK